MPGGRHGDGDDRHPARGFFRVHPRAVRLGTALASAKRVRRSRPDPSRDGAQPRPGPAILRVQDAGGHADAHAAAARRGYQRHEPEKTVLYQIVADNLETFLEEVRNRYDKPLPAYVEKELREFIRCGLLQYGFVAAKCRACGHTVLVALSCKRRGPCCTSCGARRMCNEAAHVVDHVIP